MNTNKPSRSWRGDKPVRCRRKPVKDTKSEAPIERDKKKRFSRLIDGICRIGHWHHSIH